MAKNKTTETEVDVFEFIEAYVNHDQKKTDSVQLIELMHEWSGFKPKMWGPTIIGFGSYNYTYASGHEGDAPLIAFSPRKAQFSCKLPLKPNCLKVTQNEAIRWKSYNWVYLSASLQGKHIGALDIGNGIWSVFYRNVFLGYFDEHVFRKKEQSVRLETNLV